MRNMKIAGANPLGHIGYWAAAAVIVVMGWGLYVATLEIRDSTRLVDRTFQVLGLVAEVDVSVGRAEAANRGFVLYGEQDFIPDRDAALVHAAKRLEELRSLTSDSFSQGQRIGRLEELLRERTRLLRETEAAKRAEADTTRARESALLGREVTSMIFAATTEIRAEELRLLAERRADRQNDYETANLILLASIVVALAVLIPGYVGFIRESRARARAERDLLEQVDVANEANRAKSTFLATMSHEIRTPMNGVLGMLELLALTKLDAEQRMTLAVIRESGKSLLRIIDDILDFSKIEAGKLELRPEPASVADVVARVRGVFSGNASSKGIVLEYAVDDRISPALVFDAVRVQQILGNFVSNAIKFTAKGKIRIGADLAERGEAEEVVRFSVADTGTGISDAERLRLFEPFSQARGDATARSSGTGLGLSISRRLATMMDGKIELHSRLGEGTTVVLILRLPIAQKVVSPASPEGRDEHRSVAAVGTVSGEARALREGLRVLVVDDHPINRMVLQRQVAALGYAAATAEDGRDALGQWSSGSFAAVITDCNMPEMDGYELARRIRASEADLGRPRTPVIACTANALGGDAEKCFEAGMDDYLAKPVELVGLERKLAQWLAPSAAVPVDMPVMSAPSDGASAISFEVACRFREFHAEDAILLRKGVDESDFARVVHASHRIKGASRTIGALALAQVCERIEQAARASDAALVAAQMPHFDRENERLDVYLKWISP